MVINIQVLLRESSRVWPKAVTIVHIHRKKRVWVWVAFLIVAADRLPFLKLLAAICCRHRVMHGWSCTAECTAEMCCIKAAKLEASDRAAKL